MKKEKLQCLVSGLSRYELTGPERECVQTIEQHFNQRGAVTNQQESILEDIYLEKTRFIRTAIFLQIQQGFTP